MMVDRHRNSFSHIDSRQKWDYTDPTMTLMDMLTNENDIMHSSLTLAPINSSHIYARRHSTHAVASREDKTSTINNTGHSTSISSNPPPVPKRTPPAPITPVFIPTDEPRNRPIIPPKTPKTPKTPKEKNSVPPPLPPTPKTRAPPFNHFTNHKPTLPPTREHSTDGHRKTDINRNKYSTNFPFDHVKINELPKNQKSGNNTKVNTPTTPNRIYKQNMNNKMRQDSGISTDSFSQNSSPTYTSKMETPLIPPKTLPHKSQNGGMLIKKRETPEEDSEVESLNGITKSVSTPASLQTVVKFHNGSMTLHHRIMRDMRRPSENYKTKFIWKFRFVQIVVNAIVLFAIGAGMTAYYKAYPSKVVTIVNETIINATSAPIIIEKKSDNPAPGICLPVIVRFCQQHNLPYNYTVYPNYVGHFSQRDAQQDLEIYDAVVDVRCYELTALFLCTIFVPKCGLDGGVGRPCRNICMETKRRCGFFLDVFGLSLPKYLECSLFPDSPDPNICIGHAEFKAARVKESRPICPTGFQCDVRRCIPKDWQCDGHIDCKDQSDELNCKKCGSGMIHCGSDKCINQEHMCDGKVDCPWGQDERNCLRLSERNGDEGRGQLEVFRPDQEKWVPACIAQWDEHLSKNICFLLGYAHTNYSRVLKADDRKKTPYDMAESRYPTKDQQPYRRFNLIREFASCNGSNYPTVDLVCSNFICGKARKSYAERKRTPRIVGGVASKPGDWPFLAALLGGPEEIFYCAGVLIADQWVLTASHCVGNHSNISGWTIQLGITRRHSHSFYGQKMKVKRVVSHPMYNQGISHDNDVALFQLSSIVTFHEHLLPVCLPKSNKELKPGTICTVIGWGKKEDSGGSEYEPEINEVEVPVLNRDLCNAWLETKDLNVTEGMICAGYKEGGKDACQGDSGGPLLCREKDDPERWFVGGIVSWGIKCAHPHLPGVYAYVPKYIDWIQEQMKLYSGK